MLGAYTMLLNILSHGEVVKTAIKSNFFYEL